MEEKPDWGKRASSKRLKKSLKGLGNYPRTLGKNEPGRQTSSEGNSSEASRKKGKCQGWENERTFRRLTTVQGESLGKDMPLGAREASDRTLWLREEEAKEPSFSRTKPALVQDAKNKERKGGDGRTKIGNRGALQGRGTMKKN